MDLQYKVLASASTFTTSKIITFEGKEHLITPVVILVEGVHKGSQGAFFYPAEILKKTAQFWNGMPVPIHHPVQDGVPVSCNSPDIIEKQTVGRLWNVKYEAEPKPRLKGDLYLDVQKIRSLDAHLLDAIRTHKQIEVSTGLFSEDELTPGTWNNENYNAIIKDIRPDHLALLPGAVGACSWADGCGVRANQDTEMTLIQKFVNWIAQEDKHHNEDESPNVTAAKKAAKLYKE